MCAQTNGTAPSPENTLAIQRAYDAAFQAMLADPGNLEKSYTFADRAVDAQDYEGAIAALERMLFINPNLPRVRLDLARLYFRLESYAVAQSYLDSVLEQPNVPDRVRERATALKAEIEAHNSHNQFGGSIFAGVRYQSNANSGPGSTGVKIAGLDATLDGNATGKHDWNDFLVGTLTHTYDFQAQDNHTWDSSLTYYGSRQALEKQVDLNYLEVTTGPRYVLPKSWGPLDLAADPHIRIYAIGDYIGIRNKARYYLAPGAGAAVDAQFTETTGAVFTLEMRDKDYRDSGHATTNSFQSGVETTARVLGQHRLSADWTLIGGAAIINQVANQSFDSFIEYNAVAGVSVNYVPPIALNSTPWSSTFTVTRAYIPYDMPDDTIDSRTRRKDHDWRTNFLTNIPITDTITVVASLGTTLRTSSLPNYRYWNEFASIGASWRF